MKKVLCSILSVCVLLLAACSSPGSSSSEAVSEVQEAAPVESTAPEASAGDEQEEEPGQGIEVEVGEDVVITISSDFVDEDFDPAELDPSIKDVVVNDDGSVSFTMSAADHAAFLAEYKREVIENLDLMAADFDSVVSIEIIGDFESAKLVVNKADYEGSFDSFASLGVYMQAAFYQMFAGYQGDTLAFAVELEDAETGEVYDVIEYPEAMNG